MIEVEVKARLDLAIARETLDRLGGEFVETEEHHDIYYNAPHRDFAQTDEALRLRRVNGHSVMTYKGKKLDSLTKSREELQTPVEWDETRLILERLGFTETAVVNKVRDVYKVGDITVCLDQVDSLGEFVEFELFSENSIEESRDRLFSLMGNFGLGPEDSIRQSYLELVKGE
jgi:adenylate cyclase class 2